MDLAEAPGRASPPLIASAPDVEAATADAALPRKPPTAEVADDVSEAEASAADDDEREHTEGRSASPLSEKEATKSKSPDGHSGAGVSAIRGTSGSDFEAHCGVIGGSDGWNQASVCCCPWLFCEKDVIAYGEVKRFVLVKGGTCFVFVDEETSTSPLYAIPLQGLRAEVEDPTRPSRAPVEVSPSESNHQPRHTLVTVLLTSAESGAVEYQFCFDAGRAGDEDVARRFAAVVDKYGAGTKMGNTASVVSAKTVAVDNGPDQLEGVAKAKELC